MEKANTDREKKEKDAKDKKYREAMAKVDELEKEGKYKEAWMKVPQGSEFPEKAEELGKRRTSLSDRFSTPSLFGAMEQTAPEPPKAEEPKPIILSDESNDAELQQYLL